MPQRGGGELRGLAAEAVGVEFAHGRLRVLADVGFRLPAAAVSAVVGPNGAGKTTILRALAGLVAPRAGTLRVLGTAARAARPQVRYVPQAHRFPEHLPVTVRDLVTVARWGRLGLWRPLRREDRAAVEEAMETLGITDLARRRIDELSGGQRQRVLLAQGLAQAGELLLLDEPAAGLDVAVAEVVAEVVAREREAGRAVVMVTHDLGVAAAADHVVLVGGGTVRSGPPQAVLHPDLLAAAYGVPALSRQAGW